MAPVAVVSQIPSIPNGITQKPIMKPIAAPTTFRGFDSMESALEAFHRGEFLVVMDDESRENEGDLIIAADKLTTEKMAWMVKHTRFVLGDRYSKRGLILCAATVATSASRCPRIDCSNLKYHP